jgi:hypothetical protein
MEVVVMKGGRDLEVNQNEAAIVGSRAYSCFVVSGSKSPSASNARTTWPRLSGSPNKAWLFVVASNVYIYNK